MFKDLSISKKVSLMVNIAKLTEDEINLLAKNAILANNMNKEELIYAVAIGELRDKNKSKNIINLETSPFIEKLTSMYCAIEGNIVENLGGGMKLATDVAIATENMKIEYRKRGIFYTDCRKNNGRNLYTCKDCDCFISNDIKKEVIACKFGTPIEKIEL